MLLPQDSAKLAKKTGLRFRIDMKCKDCIYDPMDVGTWRGQVELCSCVDCPLYGVRPRRIR